MPEITEAELPANAKPLWLKALTALQSTNHEYAITLLQAVLKESPSFLDARKLLRKCEVQLYGSTHKKSSFFGIQTGGMSTMKLQSAAKKDPLGTIYLIEKDLEKSPYDEQLNELLFDTCLKLELFETAAFALETVRKGHPENSKLLHKLASFYITQNQAERAIEVYNDIIKHNPTDGTAIKGSKDAAARASMQKQKWDENSDIKSLMRNASEAQELEQASRVGLTRQQLEQRRDLTIEKYNADPNHLATVKELAAIYEQIEDWHNAFTFYDWAHSLSSSDVALATKANTMRNLAIELDLQQLGDALKEDPNNEELRASLAQRRTDRLAEQVEDAKRQVDQNPTDPQLRFDLGNALYQLGDFSAAIPHLQQATKNPHIRIKVLLMLARTFQAKGMLDIAIKQLSDALSDLTSMDATKKEILFEKGLIHQQLGDSSSALDCFKQIYEVDYSYKDVAQRVESSYQ